ncbi:hypothetical protein HGRIS_000658 [Hohenbuehelia grisea]|uniref:Uncharacterized protein n=1 Tax=Hohenbuehelia grisea TaxID=104357 RepID=A0ABR3JRV8_9AGAR
MSSSKPASNDDFQFEGFPSFFSRSAGVQNVTNTSPSEIVLQAKPITDYWRTPPYAAESDAPADRESGAHYYVDVSESSDFTVGVWLRGYWGTLYDQGGLMVIAGDGEGKKYHWIKSGVELDHGKEWIGGVVAAPYSDWSVSLAPKSTSLGPDPSQGRDENAHWVYLRIVRSGPTVRVYHLFAEKKFKVPDESPHLIMLREVKGFNVDPQTGEQLHRSSTWRVGVMTCGPKNEVGETTEFADFHISVKPGSK